VRVLLDENLPESLVAALQELGHQVESVNSLRLKGVDNGTLYREVAQAYDLCLTRDAGFVHNVRQAGASSNTKLLHVTLPQQRAKLFVQAFVRTFAATDWAKYENGGGWP
jgi:predicted nuclease of predicted toxin-antitoxin system